MQTIELTTGRTRALIAPEAGGRIVQIEISDGQQRLALLVAPADPGALTREALLWGCYPMAPWPGRVADARFAWQGASYELPVNEGVHSIHGRGVYLPWTVQAATGAHCVLACDLGPHVGWPFAATLEHEIHVEDDGVRMGLSVVNRGSVAFPAGLGWHPWFRRDVRPGAEPCVRLVAAEEYEVRADLIPTGATREPSGDADLGDGAAIGTRAIDTAFRGVQQPIEMRWGDVRLRMSSSANCRHAVVYTASDRGFCVEPQTCAPDAFNLEARGVTDTGVSVVGPGGKVTARTDWRWSTG